MVMESKDSGELPKPPKLAKKGRNDPELSFLQTSYMPFDEEVEFVSSSSLIKNPGNIQVFCRMRPALREASITFSGHKVINIPEMVDADKNDTGKNKKEHKFSFDFVFPPSSTQQEIYDRISQLVLSVTDGYKVSIFAYGQTGSGKTYTMEGPANIFDGSYSKNESLLGIIPRSVQNIFKHILYLEPRGWNYHVEAFFLQIFNESIHDLLNPDSIYGNTQCEIIESSNKGSDILLSNVTISPVTCAEEVLSLMNEAQTNRTVASRRYNEYARCSHYVFQMKIYGENSVTNEKCNGILNLVDLAGSERIEDAISERDALTETKAVNKSLSTFENIMMALSKSESPVPYCESKLTYLLANSLGVNSKTLIFINISPDNEKLSETINSLRFASKVINNQPCDHHSIKFPDGILKLYNLSDDPDRRSFLDKLIKYQEDRGTPLSECPIINKKPLDLYHLYLTCKERGGFVEVTKNNQWNEIATSIGIESPSLGNILRMQYIKYLLPFECEFDREEFDYVSLISSLESESEKPHHSLIRTQELLPRSQGNSSHENLHFKKGQNEDKISIKLVLEEDNVMLVRAISDAVRNKPKKMDQSLFLCSLDVIEKYIIYPPISDVCDVLKVIKGKILSISVEDSSAWTLISTLVIMASVCPIDWINSYIINEFIVPNLEKYAVKKTNERGFTLFCSLLVELQNLTHDLPFNILMKYFNMKGNYVADIAAIYVIKYLIRKRLPIEGSIAFWIETNISKLKDDDISELYNRKQLYYGKGLKAVQDIYLIV